MHPLRRIKRVADKILRTKSDELFWRFLHFFNKEWTEEYISKEALDHPHRKLLIEKITSYAPLQSALEIGCASGPNIYILSQKFPAAEFYGVDISGPAITKAGEFFASRGIKNVHFTKTSADRLRAYGDKSMDIVFSDASLLYVSPNKIDAVLQGMLRIAKKAIILCEQHTEDKSFYNDKWVHNYRTLLSPFVAPERISFTKISSNVWGGDWGKYGQIIEVAKG